MTVLVADNACEYNTLSSVFGDHLDKFGEILSGPVILIFA